MIASSRRGVRLDLMAEAAHRVRDRGDYVETAEGKVSRKTVKAIREEYEYLLNDEWWEKYEAAKALLPPGSCIFPNFDGIPGKRRPGSRCLKSGWLHEIPE